MNIIWVKWTVITGQNGATVISNRATLGLQPPAVGRGSTGATSRKPRPRTDPPRRRTWSSWSTGSDRRWIKDASLKTLECESVNAPSQGAFAFPFSPLTFARQRQILSLHCELCWEVLSVSVCIFLFNSIARRSAGHLFTMKLR